jgi:hypothetical protein
MKTDLDHLPPGKQRELERVVAIVHEEFDRDRCLEEEGPDRQDRALRQLCARRLGR